MKDKIIFKISSNIFDRFNDNMYLSDEEIKAIKSEMNCYEHARSVVIEALKIVQKNRGWVSDDAIISIAQILNLSVSDVEEVATFYSQIFREPVGRHIIRFCDSLVCYITGSNNIKIVIENILNIRFGETTIDNRFTFLPVSCLGNCSKSPVIMIDEDTYSHIRPDYIQKLLDKYK